MKMYTAEELLIITDVGHECILEMMGAYSNYMKKLKSFGDNKNPSPQMFYYPVNLVLINLFLQIKKEDGGLKSIFIDFVEILTALIDDFDKNEKD